MAAFIQPLALETILVNFVAGDYFMFSLLIFIALGVLAGMLRMPYGIFFIAIVLFPIFFAAYYSYWYFVAISLIAVFLAYALTRFFNR